MFPLTLVFLQLQSSRHISNGDRAAGFLGHTTEFSLNYSYCPQPAPPPRPPNRQPLNLIRQAIKWYVENHTQTPPFHPLHATVIAISTLHGSDDPADLLSDLPEQEDLQTGPLELPKEQRILLAINYYHETIRTPQAESTCQIATYFRISRTTLRD